MVQEHTKPEPPYGVFLEDNTIVLYIKTESEAVIARGTATATVSNVE